MKSLAAGVLALLSSLASAQGFPERPVRLIVALPPGGSPDLIARTIAQGLQGVWPQPVVVENRPGASQNIASELVAKSAPDGYTWLVAPDNVFVVNPHLGKQSFDPLADLAPVTLLARIQFLLVVHPSVPAQTVPELIALARAKPGELTFGSAGSGGTNHLSGELFKSMAGIDLVHVPYKGSAPASVDLLGGRITLVFDSIVAWGDHIKTGKVRALGVTSLRRSAALPDVPTIAESGLAGFDVANWLGVLAPAGTPKDAIARLNAEIRIAMADAEMQRQLVAVGIDPTYSTPEAFAELIRADIPKWAKVVRASGARAD